jgi:predicted alpha/beta-hydrolase family hydrolase
MDTNLKFETIRIPAMPDVMVTGVVATPKWWPSGQRIGLVIGHDLAGGMEEPMLVALQEALATAGHLVLRFNFPFAEQKKKRPDAPAVLDRTFKTAVAAVLADPENAPVQPGRGIGPARVATRDRAGPPMRRSRWAIRCTRSASWPPGRDYMFRIICPVLFVQGARDPHCRTDKLEELLRRIGAPTRLHVVPDCGAGLEPIKRSGRTAEKIREEVLAQLDLFIQEVIRRG